MSVYSTTGLSISAWKPRIDLVTPAYVPRGTLITDQVAQVASSYSHESLANGGWWSANIQMTLSTAEGEDWLEYGLNRHIDVFNSSGDLVWAGFVDQVTYSAGTLTVIRGPMIEVTNRCSVVYTPILDATTTPPFEGTETVTTIADHAASQARYGILEEIVSGGKLLDDGTTDNAAFLRDTVLTEKAYPQSSEDLDLSGGSEVTVTLELMGYARRLDRYIYQDTTIASVQLDTKIQLVLAADPNGLFSTDYTQIAANATLVSQYENDSRSAGDILMSQLVPLGDVLFNRYTLGVYERQRITYAPVPTTIAYQHKTREDVLGVELFGQDIAVDLWDIRPARWLFLSDYLPHRGVLGAVDRTDPRLVFIEAVSFSTPNVAKLTGQRIVTLPQMIERLSG